MDIQLQSILSTTVSDLHTRDQRGKTHQHSTQNIFHHFELGESDFKGSKNTIKAAESNALTTDLPPTAAGVRLLNQPL